LIINSDFNLDAGEFCRNPIKSSSKYSSLADRRCHKYSDHLDKCEEMPFLNDLKKNFPKVARKITRDSIMTTGAAWKSEEAGPNRILRWVMLESDDSLLNFGITMSNLKPQVVAKLREKAADYDSCIKVAMWLTNEVYLMQKTTKPSTEIKNYLEKIFGSWPSTNTVCIICKLPLSFELFAKAQRGKAEIETCHKNPRSHSPDNVGFGHRECNIAQGGKSLDEFYDWIKGITKRNNSSH
jgi:hypothetical protein